MSKPTSYEIHKASEEVRSCGSTLWVYSAELDRFLKYLKDRDFTMFSKADCVYYARRLRRRVIQCATAWSQARIALSRLKSQRKEGNDVSKVVPA